MVINSTVTRYDRGSTNNHGDVFHWLSRAGQENIIIYGVKATDFKTQGLFAEVYGDPLPLDNVAIVNLHISRDADSTAGSWWQTSTNHLLLWNVTLPDQPLRWKVRSLVRTKVYRSEDAYSKIYVRRPLAIPTLRHP